VRVFRAGEVNEGGDRTLRKAVRQRKIRFPEFRGRMCGIAGFLMSRERFANTGYGEVLGDMCAALAHRGPDDTGVFADPEAGIGLAHRRLAVIDISAAGHQPMLSESGRFAISYNGEIYNFADIRHELAQAGKAPAWRGTSDTEVLLAAIAAWGVEGALGRCNGMFAFALWDRESRTLTLARDRAGEKPLYYGAINGALLFGSELHALRRHPLWTGEIDRGAVALYTRYSCVPAPYSIYRGIFKLPPGNYLSLAAAELKSTLPAPRPYWRAADAVTQQRRAAPAAGARDPGVLDELDALLSDAVRVRMISDVPVGAFLSGGIDSSLVVALMRGAARGAVKTFTIGFELASHDEAPFARAVAQHLGTEHTEHTVTAAEALAEVPNLAGIYDEPFADSSQIPTLLISRLARHSVTVALTGDGGDEVFGGYNRYIRIARWWRRMQLMPRSARVIAAAALGALPAAGVDALGRALYGRRSGGALADLVQKTGSVLPARTIDSAYRTLTSVVPRPEALVLNGPEPAVPATDGHAAAVAPHPVERMLYLDLIAYLPDDILAKVDRAAMAVSLETRIPFLDHRVIEFAWQQPLDLKLGDGKGKLLLRNLAERYVPRALLERPKAGFAVPLNAWLRGPLQEWAEALLAPDTIRCAGYYNVDAVAKLWDEHRSGRRNRQHQLWNVLMFHAWLGRAA
jgi:asparagine synthase (glutamine-hydrolysing)